MKRSREGRVKVGSTVSVLAVSSSGLDWEIAIDAGGSGGGRRRRRPTHTGSHKSVHHVSLLLRGVFALHEKGSKTGMVTMVGSHADFFADFRIEASVIEGVVAGQHTFCDVLHVIITGRERIRRAFDSEMSVITSTRFVRRSRAPEFGVVIVFYTDTVLHTAITSASFDPSHIAKSA